MNKYTLPFLRWAGGKRWLSNIIAPILKERLNGRYFEPFLGAGAMFFAISPENAYLSDINEELINSFEVVREKPEEIIHAIKKIPINSENYYKIRSNIPNTKFDRAVRFIYLNRTCYGGLYRENKKGEFNTPYGGGSRTPAPLWEQNLIEDASQLLSKNEIFFRTQDFATSMRDTRAGDLIYCDPTYRSVTRSQFDRYGAVVFDWNDQIRLAEEAHNALERDVTVIISNTYCDDIRALYPNALFIQLKKSKTIGNKSKNGNSKKEFLIILDPNLDISEWAEVGVLEYCN